MKGPSCSGMDEQGTLRGDGDCQIPGEVSNRAELIPGQGRNQDRWRGAVGSLVLVEETRPDRDPERTILLGGEALSGECRQFRSPIARC